MNGANAAQKREKPRAWQDYDIQVAKVTAVTERLNNYLDGPVSRALKHDQSTPELLVDLNSIPRQVRTDLADVLDIWLKDSRKLAENALNYPHASDRDVTECQAWIAVFQKIYEESDVVVEKLRSSQMSDGDFAGLVGAIVGRNIWDGAQLVGVMRPCYMHKRMGVFADASLKERRQKYEAETAQGK